MKEDIGSKGHRKISSPLNPPHPTHPPSIILSLFTQTITKHEAHNTPSSPDGYAMLMSPNNHETAHIPGCLCPGDMAVRMRKVLAILLGWCSECLVVYYCLFIVVGHTNQQKC